MAEDLIVEFPGGARDSERMYILDVVLGEFLGLTFQARAASGPDVRLARPGQDGALCVSDAFFQVAATAWLGERSMPDLPLRRWTIPTDLAHGWPGPATLPVLFGSGDRLIEAEGPALRLNLDVFGSAFFMLSRYEESVVKARDRFGRFPASASVAASERFLDWPIVNAYVELLYRAMARLWPRLPRSRRAYRVWLSHDVDRPLATFRRPLMAVLKDGVGDLTKRQDGFLAVSRLLAYTRAGRDRFENDPYNTFDFIMGQSERHHLKSAFYFLAGCTDPARDGTYHLHDPWILDLMRRIRMRGHEIGLHPSFATFLDGPQIAKEFTDLRQAAEAAGYMPAHWGGRQHYLRWDVGSTWRHWEAAGLSYDSTLAFAEHPGFRCGTCYEYPVYDLATGRRLKLRERPLVVMEGSLLAYEGLSWPQTAARIQRLAATCRDYRGDFTLLWHNNELAGTTARDWYQHILETVV